MKLKKLSVFCISVNFSVCETVFVCLSNVSCNCSSFYFTTLLSFARCILGQSSEEKIFLDFATRHCINSIGEIFFANFM